MWIRSSHGVDAFFAFGAAAPLDRPELLLSVGRGGACAPDDAEPPSPEEQAARPEPPERQSRGHRLPPRDSPHSDRRHPAAASRWGSRRPLAAEVVARAIHARGQAPRSMRTPRGRRSPKCFSSPLLPFRAALFRARARLDTAGRAGSASMTQARCPMQTNVNAFESRILATRHAIDCALNVRLCTSTDQRDFAGGESASR